MKIEQKLALIRPENLQFLHNFQTKSKACKNESFLQQMYLIEPMIHQYTLKENTEITHLR